MIDWSQTCRLYVKSNKPFSTHKTMHQFEYNNNRDTACVIRKDAKKQFLC